MQQAIKRLLPRRFLNMVPPSLKLSLNSKKYRGLRYQFETPGAREPETFYYALRGWIASDSPVTELALLCPETGFRLALDKQARPEVQAAFRRLDVAGFSKLLSPDLLGPEAFMPKGASTSLEVHNATGRHRIPLNGTLKPHSVELAEGFAKAKALRRKALEGLLRCPACQGEDLVHAEHEILCRGCGQRYAKDRYTAHMLTPAMKALFNVESTDRVSHNPYDPETMALIEQGGMVLDCGAGFRDSLYPNVINFEVADYFTTDVTGVNEQLPFRDASFDTVLSLAVLEHVKDPFRAAREILRVTKPGGTIMAVVPMLQPFHGYPNHYYNCTSEGLKGLFNPGPGDQCTLDVPLSGHPVFALTWMLEEWAAGLPPRQRKEFLSMRVADLIAPATEFLGQGFVNKLAREKWPVLCATNRMVLKKAL